MAGTPTRPLSPLLQAVAVDNSLPISPIAAALWLRDVGNPLRWLWMAIFADEGVALLAIMNAMRVRWYHSPKNILPEASLSRAVKVAAR